MEVSLPIFAVVCVKGLRVVEVVVEVRRGLSARVVRVVDLGMEVRIVMGRRDR